MNNFNLVDICRLDYPGQIEIGNIKFYRPEEDILISDWYVPNIPKPKESELIAKASLNPRPYELNILELQVLPQLQFKIDLIARSRGYADGVSCSSYINSTNLSWKIEAMAFIVWRDSVWNYAYALLASYEGNNNPLPAVQSVLDGIPVIQW